jgi:hypothetical protein
MKGKNTIMMLARSPLPYVFRGAQAHAKPVTPK